MMRRILFLGVQIIYMQYFIIEATVIEDYCWRDYEGKIPSDALPAGTDKDGKPLYVGQVLYENKLIAGKVRDGDPKIYIEYFSVEYSTSQNVKILCSKTPSKFEWIPTRSNEVLNLLPGKTLIKGGFEPGCTMYLGRMGTYNGFNVGKVMCCQQANGCYGLYTTNDGKGKLDGEFQILSYNENNYSGNNNDPEIEIDLRNNFTTTHNQPRDPNSCKKITINFFT